MDYSVSNFDIWRVLGKETRIIDYIELQKVKNIKSLFKNSDVCVILYLTQKNYGHWCLLTNYKNKIQFFDSYGIMPDEELLFVPEIFRKDNNILIPHLTYLLLKSKKQIEYNHHVLQGEDMKTCGRWIIFKAKMKNYLNGSINAFANIFKDDNFTPDELIYLFTKYIYNI